MSVARMKLPKTRNITVHINSAHIRDQVAALLSAVGYVNDNEDVVNMNFSLPKDKDAVIPVECKIKRRTEVTFIQHA